MHLRGDTMPLGLESPHCLDKARHGRGSGRIALLDGIIPLDVVCWHEVAHCPLPGKYRMKSVVDRRNYCLIDIWVTIDATLAPAIEVIPGDLQKLLSCEMAITRIINPIMPPHELTEGRMVSIMEG